VTLRIYWVNDRLAGSGLPGLEDLDEIASKFSAVLSLPEDWEFVVYGGYRVEEFVSGLMNRGVKVVRLPTRDGFPPDDVVGAVRILASLIEQGPVLVHCVGGRGRTPTLIAAYLVMCMGFDAYEALRLLEEINPFIEISEVQFYAIIEAEAARRSGLTCR